MAHWLTEEHTMMRDAVRRFAEKEIAPVSEKLWEEEAFPYEIWKRSAELGFTDVVSHWPREHGLYAGDEAVLDEVASRLAALR